MLSDLIKAKVPAAEWDSLNADQKELIYADLNAMFLEWDADPTMNECIDTLIRRVRPASLLSYAKTLQAGRDRAFLREWGGGTRMERKVMAPVTPAQLAGAFTSVLRSWLTDAELTAIDAANHAPDADPSVCASHDYCDANVAMVDAMERLGLTWSATDESQAALVDAAWSQAKQIGFAVKGKQS